MQECVGVLLRGKLDDDHSFGVPVSLGDGHIAAADNILSLVFLDETGSDADVLLVLLRIVDGNVDNYVCTHIDSLNTASRLTA